MGGAIELRVLDLGSERFSIGRRPKCDLVLDDPSVSPEHARIVVRDGARILQDLHSRELTRVNGWPVRLRELVAGDLIDIGIFRLRYETAEVGDHTEPRSQIRSATRSATDSMGGANIAFMAGPRTGECLLLDRERTMVADGAGHLAIIAWRSGLHAVTHLEGLQPTRVNGRPVSNGACPLAHGDLVMAGQTVVRYQVGS